MNHRNTLGITSLLLSIGLSTFMPNTYAAEQKPVDFNLDIRPILTDRCFHCHGPDAKTVKGDLRLDLEDSAKHSAIKPGDASASDLIKRILSTDPDEHMPPADAGKPSLTKKEVALFQRWINEGAVWANHWAWDVPKTPTIPQVDNAHTVRNTIDNFILAKLKEEGLSPSPEADRATLIRRAAFDITGLPPTLEEIDTFLKDTSSDAYSTMLDRLFASKHYGERMAIDWLDGARYADSNGFQNDFSRDMYPWRDWVINTFNANMPFDQFTIEQIAGDMLPNATLSQRVATGFNRNHRSNTEGGSIEDEWRTENIVDRVETTGTVFLGLTLGCARCHDHKYDPFSQKEFYQFYSFFNHTEDRGIYMETRGNAGTVLSLPTASETVKIAKMDADIEAEKSRFEALKKGIIQSFEQVTTAPSDKKPVSDSIPDFHFPLNDDTPNDSIITSTVTWPTGLFGKNIHLEGIADSTVAITSPVSIEHDKPFSVTWWMRLENSGPLFNKMTPEGATRGLKVRSTGKTKIRVQLSHQGLDNAIEIETREPFPRNQWMHMTVTYDGSSKATGFKIYFNGAPISTKTFHDTLTGDTKNDEPIRFGGQVDRHYRGGFLDLRIYNRIVTQDEISNIITLALPQGDLTKLTKAESAELDVLKNAQKAKEIKVARSTLTGLEVVKKEFFEATDIPSVMVMKERVEPRKTYRLERGAYDAPDESEEIFSQVPAFLNALPDNSPENRMGLALWLVAEENPLTARVTVNRLWYKFFGQGIVSTLDNFGTQGAVPTHPELLDWLALEFVRLDWDLKALQKTIMLSATYRQNSNLRPELLNKDPKNLLLARGPRFRLKAELIRDNALAASGLLVRDIGGRAVKPYQPDGMWMELAGGANQGPYKAAEGDDLYRRSLYTVRKRTVPHATMSTFDAPSFEICQVKRARTNTPLQALALLNDTTYVEAARHLAQRMIAEGGEHPQKRIAHGFRLATGRYPSQRELKILTQGLAGYETGFASNPEKSKAFLNNGVKVPDASIDTKQLAAYSAVASVILNLDETITKE